MLASLFTAITQHLLLTVILLKANINAIPPVPYGLAVRIPGFHPGGPGSTPGMGTTFLLFIKAEMYPYNNIYYKYNAYSRYGEQVISD